jgi:DNA mismatch repair ATPase MutS
MKMLIYIISGFIAIIGFIFTLRYSKAQNKKRMLYKIRTQFGKVPDREFNRENVRYLMDSEREVCNIDEITWNDLDMDKVFSKMNNCNSFIGEQVLYKRLHTIEHDRNEFENSENMLQRFLDDRKYREDIQLLLESLGRRKNSYNLPQFINECESFEIMNIWLYRVMSLLLVCSLVLGIIINHNILYAFFIIFLINVVIYALGKFRFELHFEMLGTVVAVVTTANTLIQKYNIDDGELEKESIESAKRMNKAVKKIVMIQRKMETALSGDVQSLIFDYIIGGTLWEFHVYHRIVVLLKIYKNEFMKLYNFIGEIDATISIASYRESIPHYCQPYFHEDNMIHFAEMFHPLISNPVCNDVNMKSNHIITGSNASGKSTYIKAVAINMILAQSINMVLAKKAWIPYANILTSMAVRDDIASGESYYIREINYLKRIIMQIREDKLTLCIVDEILRGTNTDERIAASVAILNYLNDMNCLAIVASHDVKISEILEGKFENCHFGEVMEQDDILFDYKIKMGVSKSKNAIKLLGHIGFPKEIIKHAEELLLQL